APSQLAIDPHGGVGHRAVDLQEDSLARIRRSQVEGPPVPADAGTRKTPHASAAPGGDERPLDGPIMRKVNDAPGTVVVVISHIRHVPAPVPLRTLMTAGRILDERIR